MLRHLDFLLKAEGNKEGERDGQVFSLTGLGHQAGLEVGGQWVPVTAVQVGDDGCLVAGHVGGGHSGCVQEI